MSDPNDNAWKSLGEFIKSQRELAHLSLRQLAETAKISNPYLSQVERGLYKPSADILRNIANALKSSAETMYAEAGLLSDEAKPVHQGVEQAIRLDHRLSSDQKETLIRVYRAFVQKD